MHQQLTATARGDADTAAAGVVTAVLATLDRPSYGAT